MMPERTFASADEMLAHYRAVRVRMGLDVRRPVVVRSAPPPPPEPPQEAPEPEAAEPVSEPDDPERLPVRAIIARVAEKHGLRAGDILGPDRRSHVVAARWRAIADVHKAYPTKGLPWLGAKFGMDHTSVLNALQKLGLRARRSDLVGGRPTIPPMPEEQVQEAVRLYQSGISQKNIAAHFGVPQSRIYELFKARGIRVCRVVVLPS